MKKDTTQPAQWPDGRVFLRAGGGAYTTENKPENAGGAVGWYVLAHPLDLDAAWNSDSAIGIAAETIAIQLASAEILTEREAALVARDCFVRRVSEEEGLSPDQARHYLNFGLI